MKKFALKLLLSVSLMITSVPLLSLAERYYFEYQVYESNTLDSYVHAVIVASVFITSSVAVALWAFATVARDYYEEAN